jgi:hypothetical protein
MPAGRLDESQFTRGTADKGRSEDSPILPEKGHLN